ncbi:protein ripply3 isoform X2 [Mauremys mutica]|uniref:protein ripply3 isoform X2 n=1 Tax=Mauremys mutica TaxID=74926 RepID=UPI001D156E33|nr:protein ripply3 isoform X2 [Mauremys mutica]
MEAAAAKFLFQATVTQICHSARDIQPREQPESNPTLWRPWILTARDAELGRQGMATIADMSVYLCALPCSGMKLTTCPHTFKSWHTDRFCPFTPGFQFTTIAAIILQKPPLCLEQPVGA